MEISLIDLFVWCISATLVLMFIMDPQVLLFTTYITNGNSIKKSFEKTTGLSMVNRYELLSYIRGVNGELANLFFAHDIDIAQLYLDSYLNLNE